MQRGRSRKPSGAAHHFTDCLYKACKKKNCSKRYWRLSLSYETAVLQLWHQISRLSLMQHDVILLPFLLAAFMITYNPIWIYKAI